VTALASLLVLMEDLRRTVTVYNADRLSVIYRQTMKLIRQPLQHMSPTSVFSTSLFKGKLPLQLLGQASLTRRKYNLPSTMRIMSRIVEVLLRTPIACEDSKIPRFL